MRRLVAISMLMVFMSDTKGQSFLKATVPNNYQSPSNPYYWKNRMPDAAYWQQDVHYSIKANVKLVSNTKNKSQLAMIEGQLELVYTNNSPDTLTSASFHLYQNAFTPGSNLHNLEIANKQKTHFGAHESQGLGTKVETITQNGKLLNLKLDNTILDVRLSEPLLPGKSTTFAIVFNTYFDIGSMRRRMKIFETAPENLHIDGVHWYPRICVYDHVFKWERQQHLGKEFYGDYGTYDVELSLPNHYIAEATGTLINQNEVMPADLRKKLDISNFTEKPKEPYKPSVIIVPDGTYKTWRYHAENVHDFAFTADPTYRIGETEWNGIKCVAIAQERNAYAWQPTAKYVAWVVKTYSEDFGMYGYPKMVAADAADGMEYPMLTLDGGNWPGHQNVIAHEIGHNWFFGMIGNNETYRAMLDEGFTQFLTAWSLSKFKEQNGIKYNRPMALEDNTAIMGYMTDAMNHDDAFLNTHSDDFNGALGHGGGYRHVYYKTATMLYNLQYVLGDDLFSKAMKYYFNKWKFCHPYPQDFREAITEVAKTDLTWFFDQWMETTKVIDYKIAGYTRVKKRSIENEIYQLDFVRTGSMQMPLDIRVESKSGKFYNYYIGNTGFVKPGSYVKTFFWTGWGNLSPKFQAEIVLPKGERLKDIIIDPSRRLADIYRLDNKIKKNNKISFDKGFAPIQDLDIYQMRWRPDVWWNSIDGFKVGLNWEGQYMNHRHVSGATVWANTGIMGELNTAPTIDFSWFYRDRFAKNTWFSVSNRFLDKVDYWKMGITKLFDANTFKIEWKRLYRDDFYNAKPGDNLTPRTLFQDVTLVNPYNNTMESYTFWKQKQANSFMEVSFDHLYNYLTGSGKVGVSFRSAMPGSVNQYSWVQSELINTHVINKISMKMRLMARIGHTGYTPEESMLYLAGASPEEMYDNKYTRASGFVPSAQAGISNQISYFQQGGGLNLRGYAGYQTVSEASNYKDSGIFFNAFRGNSGIGANFELNLGNLVTFKPKLTRNWLKVDPYLFTDGGMMLANVKRFGEIVYLASQFRMDAGIGMALSIKKWYLPTLQKTKKGTRLKQTSRDGISPLSIRFDLPFFINRPPANDEYINFNRFVIGINRAF